jgi:anti-sigma factor RsiW
MNCERVRELLSDYSLGLVSPRDRDDLQAHLSGCEECSRQLGQIRAMDGMLASERLEAPEAMVQRVMAQARAEGLRRSRGASWHGGPLRS